MQQSIHYTSCVSQFHHDGSMVPAANAVQLGFSVSVIEYFYEANRRPKWRKGCNSAGECSCAKFLSAEERCFKPEFFASGTRKRM